MGTTKTAHSARLILSRSYITLIIVTMYIPSAYHYTITPLYTTYHLRLSHIHRTYAHHSIVQFLIGINSFRYTFDVITSVIWNGIMQATASTAWPYLASISIKSISYGMPCAEQNDNDADGYEAKVECKGERFFCCMFTYLFSSSCLLWCWFLTNLAYHCVS